MCDVRCQNHDVERVDLKETTMIKNAERVAMRVMGDVKQSTRKMSTEQNRSKLRCGTGDTHPATDIGVPRGAKAPCSAEDDCTVPPRLVGRALTESARWTRFKLLHCGRPLRARRRRSRETWREVAHSLIEHARHAESLRKRYRLQGATESQRRSLERFEEHIRDICNQADEYCLGPHPVAGRRRHRK